MMACSVESGWNCYTTLKKKLLIQVYEQENSQAPVSTYLIFIFISPYLRNHVLCLLAFLWGFVCVGLWYKKSILHVSLGLFPAVLSLSM